MNKTGLAGVQVAHSFVVGTESFPEFFSRSVVDGRHLVTDDGPQLIPTIVLLFAVDIKIAGSPSLLVSLPTMLVAFARYSRDQSSQVVRANTRFVFTMAAGSIVGTVLGGLLLGIVPGFALIPALAVLLLISAVKVWRHQLAVTDARIREQLDARPVPVGRC
ncbi:TSUP family transporter [Nocardia sp. IFM 10818]